MSSSPTQSTTVWALATATGQPLAVVIFQAVAYGAWREGGVIDAEWAGALNGVLHSTQPWRRQTRLHPDEPADEPTGADPPGDPTTRFAASVLARIGVPVEVSDLDLAGRLADAGLGTLSGNRFTGFADEAPTWADLAAGRLDVNDVGSSTR